MGCLTLRLDLADLILMAELIAIRSFMKLKVLDAIPEIASISLQALSKITGVQDSLLGELMRDSGTSELTLRQKGWVAPLVIRSAGQLTMKD